MSEVRKLLNIKSDTYESGDLGITSFKDCPYKCVGGILIDPYQHKKEPCPYCQEKRRDLIKYSYKDKSDGKTIEEVLRLPKSFSSVAYDIDTIVPASVKKELTKESLSEVIDELKALMSKIRCKELPTHSYLFNLGKKAYEGNYIHSFLSNAYISGFDVAPYLSDFDIVTLRQKSELGITDKEIGITYSDLLTKDLVVIVISAGATNTSLLAVKGLMQMRAYKELSTIIFTNYWGIVMQSFCDDIPTYSLAKLCTIEYIKKESEEQVEQSKNKPIVNNTASMTAEQFKNLFKSS